MILLLVNIFITNGRIIMLLTRICTSLRLFLLCSFIVALAPTQHTQAISPQAVRDWAHNHRILCYAGVIIPCFALYAHKVIKKFVAPGSTNDATKKPAPEKSTEPSKFNFLNKLSTFAEYTEDVATAFTNAEKLISTFITVFNRLVV